MSGEDMNKEPKKPKKVFALKVEGSDRNWYMFHGTNKGLSVDEWLKLMRQKGEKAGASPDIHPILVTGDVADIAMARMRFDAMGKKSTVEEYSLNFVQEVDV